MDKTSSTQETHDQPLVKIGVVAQRLGISIRTIHMYEREGLFLSYKNKAGTRYFSERDVKWLISVRKLIKSGISIAGIRRLLSLVPCWEIKGCEFTDKKGCKVIKEDGLPCWANQENLCGETLEECRKCSVYDARFCVSTMKLFLDIKFKPDIISMLRELQH